MIPVYHRAVTLPRVVKEFEQVRATQITATDPPVAACGNPEPMAMDKPVRVPVRDPGEKFDSSVV